MKRKGKKNARQAVTCRAYDSMLKDFEKPYSHSMVAGGLDEMS